MGMDLVEIVVRVEDAFGIQISDAEATRITTTRELADFVATKVPLSDEPSCLSQQSFYFLRKRFSQHLSFSPSSFYPNAWLEGFVPKENRRIVWATLQAETGANTLPDLARPIWLFWTLAAATVFVFFYVTVSVWNAFTLFWALSFGLTAAVGFGYVLAIATRPMKQNFRRRFQSVGEVARYLVANKPHVFKRDERTWTRVQILAVVREIIAEEAGIEDFADDAHFINDLHLG
jgi:acyl carrier protein